MAAPKSKKRSLPKDKLEKVRKSKSTGHDDSLTFSDGAEENVGSDYLPAEQVGGRKRSSINGTVELGGIPERSDVPSMLDRFGADISKAFLAKRKRLEIFTKSSLKASHQMIEQMWKAQQNERQTLSENYSTQFNAVFQQWDTDVQKSKEQDEKLANLFRQQQRMFQQMRTSQGQRLKSIKQLLDQYMQSLEELQKTHRDNHATFQTELRQEMALLQKKILMETQQQDLATVRQSLQTMLL